MAKDKHPGGRPIEYTQERLEEIRQSLEQYIDNTEIPILAEFAYMNHIRRQALYEHEELSDTLKRLIDKKEAQLERLFLFTNSKQTMAIFSLKQLGWSDKSKEEENNDILTKMAEIAKQLTGEE